MKINPQMIEAIMARKGWNFITLAAHSTVSRQTLSTIKYRGTCKPEIAGKIAKALNCDVTDLLQEDTSNA